MAKRVRSDMFSDAGFFGVFFDNSLDGARSEPAEISRSVYSLLITRVVQKESGEGIMTNTEIVFDGFGGRLGNKNRAVLVAFTTNDKFAAVEID